jgi:hypothetical protein
VRREAGAPSLLGDATRRTAYGADTNMHDVISERFGGAGVSAVEQGPACGMRPASGAGGDTNMHHLISERFGGAGVRPTGDARRTAYGADTNMHDVISERFGGASCGCVKD